MERLHPAKAGSVELPSRKFFGRTAGIATALALLMSSQASFAETPDASMLIAELDGIRFYCDEHYPHDKVKVEAFIDGLLSQAPRSKLEQVRKSSDHEKWTRQYAEKLAASGSGGATCTSLAALGTSPTSRPREHDE